MGKAERGTPKDIANRMKAKGLQKLRWYCQMCEKQCRDENGFKCHIMSESHQRQLLLCAEDPTKFQDEFSNQFLGDFLNLLRRRWGTKRVWNNAVYNEYIMDRDHVHMNSTRWLTLSEFTEWLGKEGHCEVDYQEGKGWFLAYVDKDPETMARKKELQKLMKRKNKDNYEEQLKIEQMIEEGKIKEARELACGMEDECHQRMEEEMKIEHHAKIPKLGQDRKTVSIANICIKTGDKLKVLSQPERWVQKGAVVKITTKALDGFHKQKGFITEVSGLRAVVQLVKDGKRAKFDQKDLETVIPQPGREVVIMKGELAKKVGVLKEIRQAEYRLLVDVKLSEDESTEVFFKFDEVSKKHEKKKKVIENTEVPVQLVPIPPQPVLVP